MTQVSPKRRQWLVWLLAVGTLLVVAPVAWRYRPLSETERKLMGIWRSEGTPDEGRLTFARGRRFSANADGATIRGDWHALDGKLYLSYDHPFPQTWNETPLYLKHLLWRDPELDVGPIDLKFEGTRVHLHYRIAGVSEESEEVLERAP